MKQNVSTVCCTLFFLLLLLSPTNIFPQEPDITSYLIKIEAGEKEEVSKQVPLMKQKYPGSSSIIYLEALLTEDGEKAIEIYKSLVDKYPTSKYADDAMYRIYTYFYALDDMNKAEFYLNRLKNEYPESPYIKLTEKVTFGEKSSSSNAKKELKTYPTVRGRTLNKEAKFTVQAGAFTRKENALKLKSDFDKAGYTSEVLEKSVGGSLFHVVYVGKFVSDEEARSFLSIINSKFELHGWVVKID
jgi:tetratricopeptide (TPR) repeat protein